MATKNETLVLVTILKQSANKGIKATYLKKSAQIYNGLDYKTFFYNKVNMSVVLFMF